MTIPVVVDTLVLLKAIFLLFLTRYEPVISIVNLRSRDRIEMLLAAWVINAALRLQLGSCELHLFLVGLEYAVLTHLRLGAVVVVSLI